MNPERYEDRHGFFRPVIRETFYKYLGCGALKQGFARVRCRDCGHVYLLGYSCRWRPPPVMPGSAPRAPAEREYLRWVECLHRPAVRR